MPLQATPKGVRTKGTVSPSSFAFGGAVGPGRATATKFFRTRRRSLVAIKPGQLDSRAAGIIQNGRNGSRSNLFTTASTRGKPAPVVVAGAALVIGLIVAAL